jgi:phenylalanyl-tRNA synthetase beta chain
MHASVLWLNEYLTPSDLRAEEAAEVLINLGFPIESRTALHGGDFMLDVEITSNRGDCLSQTGLAREIAAKTGRGFRLPRLKHAAATGVPVASSLTLENRSPEVCPHFTARVIKGVTIGPSPAWLVRALEAVGQRSINNVVDVTNFVCFELGNPSHVFDLAKLAGRSLIVRFAKDGERLFTLDGKERKLRADELVVADAERAQSLAGVIGGGESEVSASTTDVVLEVATWDPATIRRAARRLGIRTDAGHRFERVVDARTLAFASERAAGLILEVAGGTICDGVLTAGRALPNSKSIELRLDRCREILGYAIEDSVILKVLGAQGLSPKPSGAGTVSCEVPPTRADLVREIDLIEEVARTHGLDKIPVMAKLPVAVRPPQDSQRGLREVARVLTGLGFYETVTFSFVKPAVGKEWLPSGMSLVNVDDDRRGAEPSLRPSVVPSLLACRKANQDGRVRGAGEGAAGGIRLYEIASAFGQHGSQTVENRNIALLVDVPMAGKRPTTSEIQTGYRTLRGAIETLVTELGGASAGLVFEKAIPHVKALDAAAYARITLRGTPLGYAGLVSAQHAAEVGLEGGCVAAELNLATLLAAFPAVSVVKTLPTFPAVERDLSPVLPETMTWDVVRGTVMGAKVPRLEAVEFVGTFRGKQIGVGKKSVTLRLRFRDPAKTLRHEEVDAEVQTIVGVLNSVCAATWRTV